MKTGSRPEIRRLLELYKALGFERIPLSTGVGQQQPVTKDLKAVVLPAAQRPQPLQEGGGKEAALQSLREEIGDCLRCGLSGGRNRLVFGEGSSDARIMFIGEAPGAEEDVQG
ncbi:MAG: hypothetical protein WC291_11535, partial [Thermodesulfovibrionales bacterium]